MVCVRREALWEYIRGALWVLPTIAVVMALGIGLVLSQIEVSSTRWFVFQGTPDDARTLLIAISSTLATVIALVLGLTVVALQLASTQFSPRLLRNFLRDRTNQVVLSVFVATFTYSTAGLFTVGVAAGQRVEDYPRLAVSFALVLLFVSLLMLVFFVHHLAHSIQIDEVMRGVERSTLRVIEHDLPSQGVSAEPAPSPPAWAVAVPAYQSGWVQTMRPDVLLPLARDARPGGGGVHHGGRVRRGRSTAVVAVGTVPGRACHRTRRPSARRYPWRSVWATSAPPNRMWPSGCGSSPTSPSRHCLPPSTTRTRRSRRWSTWASSSHRLVRRPLGNQRLHDDAGTTPSRRARPGPVLLPRPGHRPDPPVRVRRTPGGPGPATGAGHHRHVLSRPGRPGAHRRARAARGRGRRADHSHNRPIWRRSALTPPSSSISSPDRRSGSQTALVRV